jgi:uncharacterized cupredoxin-like copper-binding protein
MRRQVRLTVAVGTTAVVLATGSTIAMAASGGFHSPARSSHSGLPRTTAACAAPTLPGAVVDVTLADMGGAHMGYGGMMAHRGMPNAGVQWPAGSMSVQASRGSVPAGTVSLRVVNTGALTHELVVLPLTGDARPGGRAVGPDGTVAETGSLGEASDNCGANTGDGIAPGGASWTTVTLQPGRYELVCNVPGHYAAGMYAELDVTS